LKVKDSQSILLIKVGQTNRPFLKINWSKIVKYSVCFEHIGLNAAKFAVY